MSAIADTEAQETDASTKDALKSYLQSMKSQKQAAVEKLQELGTNWKEAKASLRARIEKLLIPDESENEQRAQSAET